MEFYVQLSNLVNSSKDFLKPWIFQLVLGSSNPLKIYILNIVVLIISAKTLEEMNTNQMTNTNAQQLLTQFVYNDLDDSTESKKEQKTIQLLNDSEGSEDESKSNILVNETIIEMESEESSNDCNAKLAHLLVVPETEPTTSLLRESYKNQLFNPNKHHCSKNKNGGNLKEKRVHPEEVICLFFIESLFLCNYLELIINSTL